jgi:hypothetical protein
MTSHGRGRVPHSFAVFANEWARRTALVINFFHRTAFNFERPLLIIHSHCSNFTVKVRAKTAPPPLFRSFHQFALYRVPVHVTQLLNVFALAPHVKIVETLLPDPLTYGVTSLTRQVTIRDRSVLVTQRSLISLEQSYRFLSRRVTPVSRRLWRSYSPRQESTGKLHQNQGKFRRIAMVFDCELRTGS